MPWNEEIFFRLSDLVVNELEPCVGWARKVVPVDIDEETEVAQGTVVFRARGIDPTVPFAPITAAANLAITNEYAVLFGDNYNAKPTFFITQGEAVSFFNQGVILKEKALKDIYVNGEDEILTEAQFEGLKLLLERQGIRVEHTLV